MSEDPRSLLRVAQEFHFAKRFNEAAAIYERLVDEFPDTREASVARNQLKNLQRVTGSKPRAHGRIDANSDILAGEITTAEPPAKEGALPQTYSAETGSSAATKRCPHCAELIQAAANKCRYCSEWLNKGSIPATRPADRVVAESRTQGSSPLLSTFAVLVLGGVALVVYKMSEGRKAVDAIGEYTDRIREVVQQECPSLSRSQAYDIATDVRAQAQGNAAYCFGGKVPTTQGKLDECMAGPPAGYPPLSEILAFARSTARMACR